MEYHEYANLFPMLGGTDLKSLADDISEKGLQDPIITLDGKILDGRNRYRACELASVPPRFAEYEGDDALGYVISHNLHRRHLTESQRAMVAAKWAKLKHGGDRKSGEIKSPIGDLKQSETKTRDEAAALLSVGTSSIDRAKQIIAKGAPGLAEMVEQGKVSVDSARLVSRMDKEDQAEVVAKGPAAIKEKASEIRGKTKPHQPVNDQDDEPEALVVDATKSKAPKWVSDDAERLWLLAKIDLDKILPTDISRERVLREVIKYAETRIQNNK